MPSPSCPLLGEEHLRQLHRVYGPISPAFAIEELGCSLQQATGYLYGLQADHHTRVSLPDMVRLCSADQTCSGDSGEQ
ncbi:hypothetical protein [Deinococcus hopiensis]|uniref:Uncharacterized protein n=1 Tax=Deinococcus hopiensis KR-140 TaxID=695939 RepID=A0A1W1U9K0_9DEIO|nr:hypothetical protein [Deinococcus hopiensis]SMB77747.1 hypothetical protein SAMN00790413_03896 [Deinococcus hopiensis KR-140]